MVKERREKWFDLLNGVKIVKYLHFPGDSKIHIKIKMFILIFIRHIIMSKSNLTTKNFITLLNREKYNHNKDDN